ncbi:hypothetical protein [Kribbella sp. NBC_00359]|uniref:hypothetical protein n=1 Tax=Kribbella sp. NBC_00359 TaxID=2975966 RepID=UPI002E1F77A4
MTVVHGSFRAGERPSFMTAAPQRKFGASIVHVGDVMAKNEDRQLAALTEIARIAGSASQGAEGGEEVVSRSMGDSVPSCRIKSLPGRLREKAAQFAAQINPVNSPLHELLPGGALAPLSLTLLTAKYWGPSPRQFSVSFLESTPADLRARIVSHMNAWTATADLSFAETSGTGEVRISRGPGGYYSYLGTDIALIPENRQTMNLEGFTMSHPESEFRRVVRHETGHTLGFPHEHMRKELVARIDPAKAYPYFLATQGWDKVMVDQQVLTPLDDSSIFGTRPDQDSIMCYQLPAQITFDGLPIQGGTDINATDFAFAALIYPKLSFTPEYAATRSEDDWDPSEDVLVPA